MDWETSKENYQPLKQGRQLSKLHEEPEKAPAKAQACAEQERRYLEVLSRAVDSGQIGLSCHEETFVALKEVLEGARTVHRERPPGGLDTVRMHVMQADCALVSSIRSSAEADNLRAGRFIKQTQDTFKSGGQKAELLPLLERCTRELQSDDRYKKDIRYLRVWIQYVSQLPLRDPLPA